MEGRLLLDVVIREGAAVLELLAGKDEALLVGRDALLVLDLGLDVVDRVRGLDLERDRLTRQGLDKDLHGYSAQREGTQGQFQCSNSAERMLNESRRPIARLSQSDSER